MKSVSGRLVIITILSLALAAAAGSWWFRYAATHKTAQHWGPAAARLIRGAPRVKFYRLGTANERTTHLDLKGGTDISNMPGLTHLRYALLEDESYEWPARTNPMEVNHWRWAIRFANQRNDEDVLLLFSEDWAEVTTFPWTPVVSSRPIADGLATMFAELAQQEQAAR